MSLALDMFLLHLKQTQMSVKIQVMIDSAIDALL